MTMTTVSTGEKLKKRWLQLLAVCWVKGFWLKTTVVVNTCFTHKPELIRWSEFFRGIEDLQRKLSLKVFYSFDIVVWQNQFYRKTYRLFLGSKRILPKRFRVANALQKTRVGTPSFLNWQWCHVTGSEKYQTVTAYWRSSQRKLTSPKGNSEFCCPETFKPPMLRSRGNKTHYFPLRQFPNSKTGTETA